MPLKLPDASSGGAGEEIELSQLRARSGRDRTARMRMAVAVGGTYERRTTRSVRVRNRSTSRGIARRETTQGVTGIRGMVRSLMARRMIARSGRTVAREAGVKPDEAKGPGS